MSARCQVMVCYEVCTQLKGVEGWPVPAAVGPENWRREKREKVGLVEKKVEPSSASF